MHLPLYDFLFAYRRHLMVMFCCLLVDSKPMETFTFKTGKSYKAYQAIMAARAGSVSCSLLHFCQA
jgi:hypothetical protein